MRGEVTTAHKPLLVVVGPLPPPLHGVAISTELALKNPLLREHFHVDHLNTTDRRGIANLGQWDLANVLLALGAAGRLAWKLRPSNGLLYLPLSENRGGFLRDSIFVQLAALRGWKVAIHIRNSLFREFYVSCGPVYRRWIRATLSRVDGLAVLGETLRHLFEGLVPDEIVSVVPNGTPDTHHVDVAPDPKRVLYLSNLSLKKGIDHAVDAALLVGARNESVRFLFVGEWESEEVERGIRSRVAADDNLIEFRAPVSGIDRDRLLCSAWLLLFPVSWGEGHPRILLESLAAGVPVVTTNRATIAETIVDGECGFVLEDPDPEALAERILNFLGDHELRKSMSVAARRRYLERYTQDKADRTLAAWLIAVASS
jgi:glycosyltransferase involved in cell wall biosynthesis